ncbi:amidohydrolase family protein [Castellaniella hirudinis]|uniref:Amidohydrolase family protein n=1 Tax=Castellaniella hirudinis TaxID=1144617 RepID=A0ABV8S1T7_9BURK
MSTLKDMHERAVLLVPEQVLLPDGVQAGLGVRVEQGVITDVEPVGQFATQNLPVISLPRRLLMPGFIDAHHHVTQTFGKSLVFGEPSEIFMRVWVPMEQYMDAEAIDVATRLAAWESLRGGFTTVADAGTRATVGMEIVADALTEVGVRCVLGAICNDLQGGKAVMTKAQVLDLAQHHLNRWNEHDLIHPSLAISIPEAASDEVLVAVTQLSREARVPFQTHLNEHLAAVERSLVASGLRPLQRLGRLGAIGPELLAAHATLLTPDEITLLRDSGAAVSYNPVASSWKGNAVAPALLLSELGVRLGLGTDGTRSDAFRLLDAAETAQRLAMTMSVGDSSSGGGWRWLDMGLRGGADAVGLSGKVGEIAPGAYADMLVVKLDVPEFVPSWDLEWELVRLANRDQIESVIVQGRLRLDRGKPVDWDGEALMERARTVSEHIVANAPIRRVDPFAGEHRAQWRLQRP